MSSLDEVRVPVERLTPDRRREQTRTHLLDAAAQVFASEGFRGASIDAIAAAAGFTKGAVYSNFKNKEDLFIALVEQRVQRQVDLVQEAMARADYSDADLHDQWVPLTTSMLWGDREWTLLSLEFALYAARNPSAARKLTALNRQSSELLIPLIERQVERLGVSLDIAAEDLVEIFFALYNGIAIRHVTDPEIASDRLVETSMQFLLRALLGDTERSPSAQARPAENSP
jgi:AcrR family transcriptional regulator